MRCTDYQSVLIICHLKKLGIDITCAFAFCTEVELVIAAIRTCNCSRHTIPNSPYYYGITASSTDNAAVDNIYNAVRGSRNEDSGGNYYLWLGPVLFILVMDAVHWITKMACGRR